MRIPRRRRTKLAIDLTPMIDCVFQLLIFFMLSSSFQPPMIQLALPRASSNDGKLAADILVSVDAKGQFFVNQSNVASDKLEERLRDVIAGKKDSVVSFRGDRGIPYHLFVQVLDAARQAGAVNVNVLHEGVAGVGK